MEIRQFRVVIRSASYESSLKFYGDALALPRLETWDREDGRGTVFQAGAALIEVLGRPASEDPRQRDERYDSQGPVIKTTLVFDVQSAQAVYDEIFFRQKNIPGGLQKDDQGRLVFGTHDPDNIRIFFREP